jgi:uncharacterized membrane protein YccC
VTALGNWANGVVRKIVTFDRSALELGFAARCTAGVAIPVAIAIATGHASAGFSLAIGALIAGFCSLMGVYRSRIVTVLAATLGMAVASFVGAWAAPSVPALVVMTAIIGYLYGTIAQLGTAYGFAALNTAVAFIIFSSLPLTPGQDLQQSLLLLAGGLIQVALQLVVWPFDRFAVERRALAAAYRELADIADELASTGFTEAPIAALTNARQILADQQPLARSRDIARFKRLLADAEALRHRLGALMAMRSSDVAATPAGLMQFASAVAIQTRALASTLDGTMSKTELEATRVKTYAVLLEFERTCAQNALALALARDIAAHLRDAFQGVAVVATGRPAHLLFSAAARPSAYIETRIDWLSRDAVRIAVVLGVAMLIGHTLFSAQRGYWIALTAALVLQPDLNGTVVRGFGRIAGTLLGALIALGLVWLTAGNPAWQGVAIVCAAAICYLTMMPNYALFSTGMTIFVVMALSLLGAGHAVLSQRVLDTLVGGALAMLGYVALPTWTRHRTRHLLAETVDSQRAFALALLDAYIDPLHRKRTELAPLRTRCWKVRTELEASIDRARAEPSQAHSIDPAQALNLLGALQSFALASMALEAGLETMSPAPPIPALQPFRSALDLAMREIERALREQRAAVTDDSLIAAYERLSHQLDVPVRPAYRFVFEYPAAYVESVTEMASLTDAKNDAIPAGQQPVLGQAIS